MKYKNKARIDFWVNIKDKSDFLLLCEKDGYSPTKVIRKLFDGKLEEMRGSNNKIN